MYFPQKWLSIGRLDALLAKTLHLIVNNFQLFHVVLICNYMQVTLHFVFMRKLLKKYRINLSVMFEAFKSVKFHFRLNVATIPRKMGDWG